jgi:hypothetical protein
VVDSHLAEVPGAGQQVGEDEIVWYWIGTHDDYDARV